MKKAFLFLLLITGIKETAFLQNIPPHSKLAFTSKEKNRVAVNSTYRNQFSAFDSLNKPFAFSTDRLPSWLHFNAATHSLSGKPARVGQYFIHIIASNADTAVHQRFMLTVYNGKTMNILTLGNSITNGTNKYNSYRRPLWQLLHKANYNFDLVGSWTGHHMGGEVPDPDFDMDHDGHSGWKASDVLNPPDWDRKRGNIHQWLQTYTPGIVLMELGTNEVFQCIPVNEAMNNINAVIDSLRKSNAEVKILLAQIPPLGAQWAPKKLCGTDTSYEQAVKIFNEAVVQFVHKKNTKQSPVIVVDQFTGVDPALDMYDDIHPNNKGEMKMAQRWYKALEPFLTKLN